MNRTTISTLLLFAAVLLTAFCTHHKTATVTAETAARPGFAVVELFTSEGCSSCPAADKAVEELAGQYPDNVYVLGFHVDYWDRLGWADRFSNGANTDRQNKYAAQFGLTSIYTPQVVINGRHEFVGSDKMQLQKITVGECKKEGVGELDAAAKLKGGDTITVNYKMADSKDAVNIALVQKEATTNVHGGENGGRQLHHINVVRYFTTVAASAGTVTINLPAGLKANEVQLIIYEQNKSGAITAVKKLSLS